ncbi:MAG: sigma-70 family RNA polymerase sigma factor [Clostridia bacterium]|nr:sigma-70 family RNA polymerase sigma factor [Clostridia bacterium]
MENELEILEIKFNYFLNQTIIGASKDYYNKQKKYEINELQIIDDESYEEYLKEYIKEDCQELDYVLKGYDAFDEFADNPKLNNAVQKSLSDIERIVIFLYFKNAYKTNEIAKILDMREQSISRIKKRALDKLKLFMERDD